MSGQNGISNALKETTISDAVSTSIYAAAVHVLLSLSVDKTQAAFLLPPLFILFMFVDWLSRIRVPMTFQPPKDRQARRSVLTQLSKGGIEVLCAYCLLMVGASLLFPSDATACADKSQRAFSFFLLASFAWNLVVIKVMDKLDYFGLFKTLFNGNTFDLQAATSYTERFKGEMAAAEVALKTPTTTADSMRVNSAFSRSLWKESFGRTIAQLIANHITWANAVIGAWLYFGDGAAVVPASFLGLSVLPVPLRISALILILFVPTVFFYFYLRKLKTNNNAETRQCAALRAVAGVVAVLLLAFMYGTLDGRGLVLGMLIQHAVFGVFVQFAVPNLGALPTTANPEPRS